VTRQDDLAFPFDRGAVWLNLLATVGRTFGPEPVERLATPARLAEWLAACELSPARPPDGDDLSEVRRLRETLRTLALATVDELPPPAGAVTDLASFLDRHDEPVRLIAETHLRREPPATAMRALARIARQAADHLSGADRRTLRSCAEHDCRSIFVDPAGRRRWCPSPACASRGRVRALRARRHTGTPTQP
jgi:predicted RNA-binding Zn ribbon-like protein